MCRRVRVTLYRLQLFLCNLRYVHYASNILQNAGDSPYRGYAKKNNTKTRLALLRVLHKGHNHKSWKTIYVWLVEYEPKAPSLFVFRTYGNDWFPGIVCPPPCELRSHGAYVHTVA